MSTDQTPKSTTGTTTSSGTNTSSGTTTSSGTPAKSSMSSDLNTAVSQLFTKSNLVFFLWFLGIYFVIYFLLGTFFKSENNTGAELWLSRSIDIIILGVFLVFLIGGYYSLSSDDKSNLISYLWQWTHDWMNNPVEIFNVAIFTIVFYISIYFLRIPMSDATKPITISFLENKLWILLATFIVIDIFKYGLNINLVDMVFGTNTSKWWQQTAVDASGSTVSTVVKPDTEVFNISNNLYTYDDAQAICKIYGAELATYDQIEESYNSGGEWCNYGWSAGQMAYFPTQKATWKKLQSKPGHENDCGRPGINGGYIANPYIRFGVNCYGKKPKPSAIDSTLMAARSAGQVIPTTASNTALNAKVKFWQDNSGQLLNINSFNAQKWSETTAAIAPK